MVIEAQDLLWLLLPLAAASLRRKAAALLVYAAREGSLKLKDGDRVVFLGWVHPNDIHGLQQQARLAINLREPDSLNDYYSLPNKFFDAINAVNRSCSFG